MNIGRINISNNCTIETPDQLLSHPKFEAFLNSYNEAALLNDARHKPVTKEGVITNYQVFLKIREAFETGVTVASTPTTLVRIMNIVDQIGESVRSADTIRVLPEEEVVQRLNNLGIDIKAYRTSKEDFYYHKGYAKHLAQEGFIDEHECSLPIPQITEYGMQKIEKLHADGTDFDLHIYDHRLEPQKRASLLIEKDADAGTKRRARSVASTNSLNDEEITSLSLYFHQAESPQDIREDLQSVVDPDEYCGHKEQVSLVCVLSPRGFSEDSFEDIVCEEPSMPADFSLLLDLSAYYKHCEGHHDHHYGVLISAEEDKFVPLSPSAQPARKSILNNISNGGKKVVVLEGNPANGFSVERVSPDAVVQNNTRRGVIYIK